MASRQHLVTLCKQILHTYLQMKLRLPETNSSRCPPVIHGRICRGTQRQVLGRSVHIPNYRASAYEKYYDAWRALQEVGMTENQRSVWVLSMPVCADFKETMYKYCCVSYETRDQHNDITSSYSRDTSDTIDQIDYRKFNKI